MNERSSPRKFSIVKIFSNNSVHNFEHKPETQTRFTKGDTMNEKQPNRIIIKSMIEEGGATKEVIENVLGISRASLASNFSYLRMMGYYPFQDPKTKILSLISEDEWNAYKNERAENGKLRKFVSPEEKYENLLKRQKRQIKAYEVSVTKHEQSPDDKLIELKMDRAEIELQITEIEIRRNKV